MYAFKGHPEVDMSNLASDGVLLGVTGSDCDAALAYVVAEVGRRGGPVRVAHAILPREPPSVPPPLTVEDGTMRVVGARLLGDVARRLEHQLPDAPVVTALLRGPASRAVVASSHSAGLVVLQRRSRTRAHVHTFAVTGTVAGHAAAPVVVVPPHWRPDPGRERTVVVGIDDVLTSPELLETAFDEATLRNARLRLVHAWHVSDAYDDMVFHGEVLRHHEGELRRNLMRELAPTLARHPEVPTELVIRHRRPADVLVAEGGTAGLVVLGRHRSSVPSGSHLGSVVRAVLRECESPVMVLDAMSRQPVDQISSGNIEMAPAGHSAAQMPQPLQ